MTRGSVSYTDVDKTHDIVAIGVSALEAMSDEEDMASLSETIFQRLFIAHESAVSTEEDANATIVQIEGIQPGDLVISAVKVSNIHTHETEAVQPQHTANDIVFEDLTYEADITDDGEISFANVVFEEGAGFIILWLDLTNPELNT